MAISENISIADVRLDNQQRDVEVPEPETQNYFSRNTPALVLGRSAVMAQEKYFAKAIDLDGSRQTRSDAHYLDILNATASKPSQGILRYAKAKIRGGLAEQSQQYDQRKYNNSQSEMFKVRARGLELVRRVQRESTSPDIGYANDGHDITMPPFLYEMKHRSGVTWHEWISEVASDDQLVNILQANVDMADQQQLSPEFSEMIDERKQLFGRSVPKLVDAGVLSESVIGRLADVDAIKIDIGDIFNTLLQGRLAYYSRPQQQIVILQGLGVDKPARTQSLRDHVDAVMTHELTHAIISTQHEHDNESHVMYSRWIEEGMTTIVDEIILTMNDILLSQDSINMYADEKRYLRQLLAVARDNPHALTNDMLNAALRAFSGGDAEYDEFSKLYDRAHPFRSSGSFAKVDQKYRDLDEKEGRLMRYRR